jgi:hypothetical protein
MREEVQMVDSQFEAAAQFVGIEVATPGTNAGTYFLRSAVQKADGNTLHQLYVSHYYTGDWIFWERANGQDARTLETVSLTRNVLACTAAGCRHLEVVGVTLSVDLLRSHAADGYAVKLYAQTGREMVIDIGPDQITAQLARVDEYKQEIGK